MKEDLKSLVVPVKPIQFGKMTPLNNLEMLTKLQKEEFITLIGQELYLYN